MYLRNRRISRLASAWTIQATTRMTRMRRRASARGSPRHPACRCTKVDLSVQAQRCLNVADHGYQARPEIVLELAFLRHERRHAAVEGDDLAVDGAAHRHAHRVDLTAQLAHRGAEAARADVLEGLVDRGAVFAVRFRVL